MCECGSCRCGNVNCDCDCDCQRRYGPSPNKLSDGAISRMRSAGLKAERHFGYRKFVEEFNSSLDVKRRLEMLEKEYYSIDDMPSRFHGRNRNSVAATYFLDFEGIGFSCRNKKTGSIYPNRGNWVDLHFHLDACCIVIEKHSSEGIFEEVSRFPVMSLTLTLEEKLKSPGNPEEKHLSIFVTHDPTYFARASFDSCSL